MQPIQMSIVETERDQSEAEMRFCTHPIVELSFVGTLNPTRDIKKKVS